MSGAYRTYRGLHGECIPVLIRTIAPAPKLHNEREPYPLARIAQRLAHLRDRFAAAANRSVLFEEVMQEPTVKTLLTASTN